MKIKVFLLAVLFFAFSTSGVKSQSLPFERAYQDYQYNRSIYDQSYSEYQNAKNAYQANQTLRLKDEAKQKTLTMLRNRDQLLVVYLTALRSNISELPGLDGTTRDAIYTKIDSEVAWYANHKTNYKDDDSAETLFVKSDEAKEKYKKSTLLTIDEALFDITLGKQKTLRQDHEQIYAKLRGLIDSGVASGKLTLNPFSHWLTDIDSTIQILKSNEAKGSTQIQQIYSQTYSPEGAYDTAVVTLSLSMKPLEQLNQFLTEILAYLKNNQ